MKRHLAITAWTAMGGVVLLGVALASATLSALQPLPDLSAAGRIVKPQLLDRRGRPITVTYQNQWNLHDTVELHEVPFFLQTAVVLSEDRRYYSHRGVDWLARLSACLQNLTAGRAVRGASTITEQVVRMMHPRPRTLWSRWLEGFEAARLERAHSKAAILEWYLNQVPYADQRRGLKQAARYYFDRDLDTLSVKEALALAVMVRAPARLNPHKHVGFLERPVMQLAKRMRSMGLLSEAQWEVLGRRLPKPAPAREPVEARHFARFVTERTHGATATIRTTLDADLQRTAQQILDQQLRSLHPRQVENGAVLVVDHQTNEILAWVVGHSNQSPAAGTEFDAVRTPRQPGSTLKPFVYALALSRDWTPATLIDDSPMTVPVGMGLHAYHNYSRVHYGPVSLRDALANSLNVPAVKAVRYVGAEDFLATLHALGFESLDRHSEFYGDGLVLGDGEVTLFEMVQAYAVLARGGRFEPLSAIPAPDGWSAERRVFSEEVASLMGHILSDPNARRLEFGDDGLLNLPIQTAAKTGTSTGYHDAWAIGYNSCHVVGVWMGNLDYRPMNRITGSAGPALVMRALFAELTRNRETAPLYFSRRLEHRSVCIETGLLSDGRCASREEWFIPGKLPHPAVAAAEPLIILRPSNGLQLALDPRIPDDREAFEFTLNRADGVTGVDWYVDGRKAGHSHKAGFLWPLERGEHVLQARIWRSDLPAPVQSQVVRFAVK